MTITFEELRVNNRFGFDIREGRGLRGIIERVLRGGARGSKTGFKKRPNSYSWCYADSDVCVAQGTSGSVAMWVACDGNVKQA